MIFKKKIITSSRKKFLGNYLLSFLFILTFILILFNKTDYYLISKIKYIGIDIVNPVVKVITSPANLISNIGSRIKNISNLENENLQLKEEIFRLKRWQTLAIKNTRENRVFKRLLNSTSDEVEIIKTASVISQSYNLYSNTITINAGTKNNVIKDLAVINEKGLVGKTITTSTKNSKILLINDPNSSVPVKSLSDKSFSIISGTTSGKYLISVFTKDETMPKKGDLLVTSGNAKIFPRDILVGKVVEVFEDYYLALPYVDFNNLDYVQIIRSK